jgi:hypothetical protein
MKSRKRRILPTVLAAILAAILAAPLDPVGGRVSESLFAERDARREVAGGQAPSASGIPLFRK